MSSAGPRAARKGRVAASSPPGEQPSTTPPTDQVRETTPSPPTLADSGNSAGQTIGSSLLSSFLQSAEATTTAAPVAVGIVRGRGLTATLKETTSTADRADVEARVKAAIETVETATTVTNGLAQKDVEAAPTKHVSHNDVTLISDLERLTVPCKLALTPKNRVFVVSPAVAEEDVSQCKAALKSVNNAVATWDRSEFQGTSDARLIFATLANFIMYLGKSRNRESFGAITHVAFVGCIHAGRSYLEFDIALSMLRDELRNTKKSLSPFVIISGASRDDFASFFEPLKCAELHSAQSRKPLTVFTAEETAALCEVSMKTSTATNAAIPRGPTTNAEPLHHKLVEHLNDTARLVVELLLDHFDAPGKPLRAVVFAADTHDLHNVLSRHNLDVEIAHSLSALESPVSRHTLVLLTQSVSDSVAARANANVVVDLGSEKRLVAAPPSEASMPLRQTVRASARETAARLHVLGWQSAGVAFHLAAGPPATSVRDEDTHASLTSAVVQAIRCNIPLPNIREAHFRASNAHTAGVEAALHALAEQCAITNAGQASMTFLGDLLGRLPLPIDAGMIAVHGMVFGLPELFALVAVSAAFDIRGLAPPGTDAAAAWLKKAIDSRAGKLFSAHSDVLVGASLIAEAQEQGVEAVVKSSGVKAGTLASALQAYRSVLHEMQDYCFPQQLAPAALKAGLLTHMNILIYVVSVTFARNAIVVRSEADEVRAVRERGRMMLQRTTKEATLNAFTSSDVKWVTGAVVVPATVCNTHAKIIGSHVTSLSHDFFHAALLLLHPALAYDLIAEQSAMFAVNVNRNPKRLVTDIETSVKILEFRDQWCKLFGVVQVRRSLPRDTSSTQFSAFLSENNRKLDLAAQRAELQTAFVQLVQSISAKEDQMVASLSKTHLLVSEPPAEVVPIATGSDEELVNRLHSGAAALPGLPAPTAAQPAASQPAAVDLEPIVEDDDPEECAPILEED